MNSREARGQVIAQRKNQIHRIDNAHYQVNSQSSNKQYDIISTERGWTRSCPDHRLRHVCCKHIHAVEISLSIRDNVKEDIIISEVKIDSCKHCNSSNIKKAGIRKNKRPVRSRRFWYQMGSLTSIMHGSLNTRPRIFYTRKPNIVDTYIWQVT